MRLILQDGDSKRGLRLKDGTFSIGSAESCNITLQSDGVEAHHADLIVEGQTVTLVALHDDAPVLIGGEAIEGRVGLDSGQHFSIGEARLKLDMTPVPETATDGAGAASKRGAQAASQRPQRVERSSRKPRGQSFPTWLILLLAIPAVLLAYKFLGAAVGSSQQDGFSEKTSRIRIEESISMSDPDKALKELEVVYSNSATLTPEWRKVFDDLKAQANEMGEEATGAVDDAIGTQRIEKRLKKFTGRYLLKNTRPEAREFIRRADKILKEFPTHPDISWVKRQRAHFAKYGKPDEPATLDDFLVEIKFLTEGKPRDYITAHARIAEFQARTDEGADAIKTKISELKESEKEYYEERIDLAAGLWERDNKQAALGATMVLLWGLSNPAYSDDCARRITQMPGVLNALQGYKRQQPFYLQKCADANANFAAFLKENGL
jgi:hypothetical protein